MCYITRLMQHRSTHGKSLMLEVIDRRNCSAPQLSVCDPECRVNRRASAKWVRVETRTQQWPSANTPPPPPPPVPRRLYTVTHATSPLRTTNTNTAILLFLFTQHNIDTVVQCFHSFSSANRTSRGALLAHSPS